MKSSLPTSHSYVSPKEPKYKEVCTDFVVQHDCAYPPPSAIASKTLTSRPLCPGTGTMDPTAYITVADGKSALPSSGGARAGSPARPPAIAFREWLGGERAINDYCRSLALRGAERLAAVLGTSAMDPNGELTLCMVRPSPPSHASLLTCEPASRAEQRPPPAPGRGRARGDLHARARGAHHRVPAREDAARAQDEHRDVPARPPVVVPLQRAGVQRGTLPAVPFAGALLRMGLCRFRTLSTSARCSSLCAKRLKRRCFRPRNRAYDRPCSGRCLIIASLSRIEQASRSRAGVVRQGREQSVQYIHIQV